MFAAETVHIDAKSDDSFHGKALSKPECDKIWQLYLDDFKTSLRPEQRGKDWTYYKRCTESKLFKLCGSKHVAYAIWEIGLPQLPSFATEHPGKELSKTELQTVPKAITNILNWLDLLASTITNHKNTAEYREAVRKSGHTKEQSGLTATELKMRKRTRDAKRELRTAKELANKWNDNTLTYNSCATWEFNLLWKYWTGSLQHDVQKLKQRSNADPQCRSPSVFRRRI